MQEGCTSEGKRFLQRCFVFFAKGVKKKNTEEKEKKKGKKNRVLISGGNIKLRHGDQIFE